MPTIGSFTIGSGGTYATWAAAFGALGNLTGPLTYTQISATFETASAVLPGGFLFNNHLMTIQGQANAHQGNPHNRGLVIQTQFNGRMFDFGPAGDDPKITIQNIHIERRTGTDNVGIYFDTTNLGGFWGTNPKILRRIMVASRPGFFNAGYKTGIWFDDGGLNRPAVGAILHHILIEDCFGDGLIIPVDFTPQGAVEHVLCRRCDNGFNFQRNWGTATVQNCIGWGNFLSDFANIGNVRGNNNASEDGSAANGNWAIGTNNIINFVVGDEFYLTSPKYLVSYPKPSGSFIGAGAVSLIPSINLETDMAGQQFPRTRVTTFGPDETIRTIGVNQYSVLITETIETEDSIEDSSVSNVSGQDVLSIEDPGNVIPGFGKLGENDLGISEVASVTVNHIVTGEDTIGILDASDDAPEFICVLDTTILRGRVNLWFPVDTLANSLVLPQPEFSDEYQLDTKAEVRHSKGGDLRVFQRHKVLTTLLMNFIVERPVRDLALAFFELSAFNQIRLYDWEGRLWHGVIVEGLDFTNEGKASDSEKYNFTLEFEGEEIN